MAKAPIRYFFLNQQLHKRLNSNRGKDLLTAWNYPERKKVSYSYTDVVRRHKKAFSTGEVANLLNRSVLTIERAIMRGDIARPQYTYRMGGTKTYKFYWQEEDIMAAHEYLASVHIGRPRNDGEITNNSLPTPRELRALINDEDVLYIKQGDTFVPTWRAKEF